jgi:hypothetical protein
MESLGNSLPPLFFESVPSLVEKPPYFSAAVTEVCDSSAVFSPSPPETVSPRNHFR